MARVSLEDLTKNPPAVDAAKLDALTEADLRAQRIAEGYDPDASLPAEAALVLPLPQVRRRLRMTQAQLAAAIGVPVAVSRDGEAGRTMPDPVARTLFKILARAPPRSGAIAYAEGRPDPDRAQVPSPERERDRVRDENCQDRA